LTGTRDMVELLGSMTVALEVNLPGSDLRSQPPMGWSAPTPRRTPTAGPDRAGSGTVATTT
jgi:hypothetical protein